MKEEFNSPIADIITFAKQDVITTSTDIEEKPGDELPFDPW